jgi:hypothetical protein
MYGYTTLLLSVDVIRFMVLNARTPSSNSNNTNQLTCMHDMNDAQKDVHSPVEVIKDPVLESLGVRLSLKRDDLIHPEISGNKWRKLKCDACFAWMSCVCSFVCACAHDLYPDW